MRRSNHAIFSCVLVCAMFFLSGCYTYVGSSKNTSPIISSYENFVSWEEASETIIPQLEDGLMVMTEKEVYALFKRPPNERQAYSDAISVLSKSYALLNVSGASSGNLSIGTSVVIKDKVPKLRGAVWTFSSVVQKNFKTLITDHSWNTSNSFLVLVLFYDGKLATMQVMSTEDITKSGAFTSERLVEYGMQATLYALPAIILAGAITKASDRLAVGVERGADSMGGSVERGSATIGNSMDGISKSIDNTGIGAVTDNLKGLGGVNGSGSITTPGGSVIQGGFSTVK